MLRLFICYGRTIRPGGRELAAAQIDKTFVRALHHRRESSPSGGTHLCVVVACLHSPITQGVPTRDV